MKNILLTFLIGAIIFNSYGQNAIDDGKDVLESYLSPLSNSFGAALNNGWYNTAKPHKLLGFDVTITGNIVMIPESAKTFNISESNNGSYTGGETATILGGSGTSISYNGSPNDMPNGVSIPVIPIPILQAGVGLIKGTELNIRYLPEIEIGDAGKLGFYGIGLKHDILQWLPIVDKIPIDLSVQAGYTKLNSEIEIEDAVVPSNIKTSLDVTATTFNLILSKKILMFTPYIGAGFNSTKTSLNINGNYTIGGQTLNASDLTNLDFENSNQFRANVGFRFNIAVLALQANYTIAEYPTATIGVGVSLR